MSHLKQMASTRQRWEVPAHSDHVAIVRRAVVHFAQLAGLPTHRVADVALAVSEAMTNVAMHAYRGAAAPGVIRVSAEVDPAGALVVIVEDDGAGVLPRPDSPGLGYGLPIMRRVTDELHIVTNGAGGRVRMHWAVSG